MLKNMSSSDSKRIRKRKTKKSLRSSLMTSRGKSTTTNFTPEIKDGFFSSPEKSNESGGETDLMSKFPAISPQKDLGSLFNSIGFKGDFETSFGSNNHEFLFDSRRCLSCRKHRSDGDQPEDQQYDTKQSSLPLWICSTCRMSTSTKLKQENSATKPCSDSPSAITTNGSHASKSLASPVNGSDSNQNDISDWKVVYEFFCKIYRGDCQDDITIDDVTNKVLSRLCSSRAHQLFKRLEELVREEVQSIRVAVASMLPAGCASPTAAKEFMLELLRKYHHLVFCCNKLTPHIKELEQKHLRRFNLTWELHNKHVFHTQVYMSEKLQQALPTILQQLRVGSSDDGFVAECPRLLREYLQFDNEMSVISVVWRDCQHLLDSYSDQESVNQTRQKMLSEDWAVFRSQRKLLESTVSPSRQTAVDKDNFEKLELQTMRQLLGTGSISEEDKVCPNCKTVRTCVCAECSINHYITCGLVLPGEDPHAHQNSPHLTSRNPLGSLKQSLLYFHPTCCQRQSAAASSQPSTVSSQGSAVTSQPSSAGVVQPLSAALEVEPPSLPPSGESSPSSVSPLTTSRPVLSDDEDLDSLTDDSTSASGCPCQLCTSDKNAGSQLQVVPNPVVAGNPMVAGTDLASKPRAIPGRCPCAQCMQTLAAYEAASRQAPELFYQDPSHAHINTPTSDPTTLNYAPLHMYAPAPSHLPPSTLMAQPYTFGANHSLSMAPSFNTMFANGPLASVTSTQSTSTITSSASSATQPSVFPANQTHVSNHLMSTIGATPLYNLHAPTYSMVAGYSDGSVPAVLQNFKQHSQTVEGSTCEHDQVNGLNGAVNHESGNQTGVCSAHLVQSLSERLKTRAGNESGKENGIVVDTVHQPNNNHHVIDPALAQHQLVNHNPLLINGGTSLLYNHAQQQQYLLYGHGGTGARPAGFVPGTAGTPLYAQGLFSDHHVRHAQELMLSTAPPPPREPAVSTAAAIPSPPVNPPPPHPLGESDSSTATDVKHTTDRGTDASEHTEHRHEHGTEHSAEHATEHSDHACTGDQCRESKQCDCCYCEFYGPHNAQPQNKQLQERRERLRQKLKRKNELHKPENNNCDKENKETEPKVSEPKPSEPKGLEKLSLPNSDDVQALLEFIEGPSAAKSKQKQTKKLKKKKKASEKCSLPNGTESLPSSTEDSGCKSISKDLNKDKDSKAPKGRTNPTKNGIVKVSQTPASVTGGTVKATSTTKQAPNKQPHVNGTADWERTATQDIIKVDAGLKEKDTGSLSKSSRLKTPSSPPKGVKNGPTASKSNTRQQADTKHGPVVKVDKSCELREQVKKSSEKRTPNKSEVSGAAHQVTTVASKAQKKSRLTNGTDTPAMGSSPSLNKHTPAVTSSVPRATSSKGPVRPSASLVPSNHHIKGKPSSATASQMKNTQQHTSDDEDLDEVEQFIKKLQVSSTTSSRSAQKVKIAWDSDRFNMLSKVKK